ncbi:Gti1/Pac2 family-domain-containing protein [Pholiota molesta]|nr:Gti1/Pac2 family-domain-containing protein [Pholiota molesta]
MQRATITGIRVRSPSDARVIFHSVFLNIFPMVTRRLDTEERGLITSGSVYVWEERGPQAELTGVGIERWTDGIRWGPSRVREGFLFYHEKVTSQQIYSDNFHSPSYDPLRSVLIKQTYTVYVDTAHGRRKWHLIAYFTEDTASRLRTVDDIPELASLVVPYGLYKSARSAKGRPDSIFNPESEGSGFSRLEYVPYMPRPSPPTPNPDLTVESSEAWQNKLLREKSTPRRSGPSSTTSSDENLTNALVPLSYLQDQPLVRREPTDQILLKKLDSYYDRLRR